jgi:hypothetical protein
VTCWLCHRDTTDLHSRLIVLFDGRLVEVCDICVEKADLDEPHTETLTYEEVA